jgi:hypothetical protein
VISNPITVTLFAFFARHDLTPVVWSLCARYKQQTLNPPLYEQGATARSNVSEKAPTTTTTTMVIQIGFFSQITSCEYSTLELVCCTVHGNHVNCILDSKFGVLEGLILLAFYRLPVIWDFAQN